LCYILKKVNLNNNRKSCFWFGDAAQTQRKMKKKTLIRKFTDFCRLKSVEDKLYFSPIIVIVPVIARFRGILPLPTGLMELMLRNTH
jgi:hypothetical protein